VTVLVLRCCNCFLNFQQYDRLEPPEVLGMMPQKPGCYQKWKKRAKIFVLGMTSANWLGDLLTNTKNHCHSSEMNG